MALAFKDVVKSKLSGGYLPLELIEIEDGFNLRNFDTDENRMHVLNLASQIDLDGEVITPLAVREKKHCTAPGREGTFSRFFLVDGESRLRALRHIRDVKGADHPVIRRGIPVIVKGDHVRNDTDFLIHQMRHNSGKRYTFSEYVDGIKRLLKMGKTQADIAKLLDLNQATVSGMLRADECPADIRQYIDMGVLALNSVIAAIRVQRGNVDEATADIRKAIDAKTAVTPAGESVKVTAEDIKAASSERAPEPPKVEATEPPKVEATEQPKVEATEQPKVEATEQPKVEGTGTGGPMPANVDATGRSATGQHSSTGNRVVGAAQKPGALPMPGESVTLTPGDLTREQYHVAMLALAQIAKETTDIQIRRLALNTLQRCGYKLDGTPGQDKPETIAKLTGSADATTVLRKVRNRGMTQPVKVEGTAPPAPAPAEAESTEGDAVEVKADDTLVGTGEGEEQAVA